MILEMGPVGGTISNGDTYRTHFKYHRMPIYRINFQLVQNAAYSCPQH